MSKISVRERIGKAFDEYYLTFNDVVDYFRDAVNMCRAGRGDDQCVQLKQSWSSVHKTMGTLIDTLDPIEGKLIKDDIYEDLYW